VEIKKKRQGKREERRVNRNRAAGKRGRICERKSASSLRLWNSATKSQAMREEENALGKEKDRRCS